ncbi:MAG: DsrE family protein [Desulfurococcales archaeon]|nr:DsrE family protein [Desulfurococcales archaeon]
MVEKFRVVFHISSYNIEAFNRMLSNIYNLLNDVGHNNADIIVIANGSAVNHFVKSSLSESTSRRLRRLRERRVKFYICRNSLKNQGLKEEDIDDTCNFIDVGITELIRLQYKGYAYIKP